MTSEQDQELSERLRERHEQERELYERLANSDGPLFDAYVAGFRLAQEGSHREPPPETEEQEHAYFAYWFAVYRDRAHPKDPNQPGGTRWE
jgi:hypothetical protein